MPQSDLLSARKNKGSCLFCDMDQNLIVHENDYCYVIFDQFAVTPKHCLIMPKRHCETFFDMTNQEVTAAHELLHDMKCRIEKEDSEVLAFNVGMNAGEAAGQTVMHSHIHLIPRRKGDHPNPRGGVRGVIPQKQAY